MKKTVGKGTGACGVHAHTWLGGWTGVCGIVMLAATAFGEEVNSYEEMVDETLPQGLNAVDVGSYAQEGL
ncbi:MAG: hypothetical protein J6U40_07185, partial [Kiritimatiellae bacterium]|nr:hypothetical protein [Kiritimatiellia bacterium]